MNKLAAIFRESIAARFLIPAGIMLIAFGIIYLNASIQNKDFIKTEAVVSKCELEEEAHTEPDGSRVEATYLVTVRLTVDGKEYEAELGGMSEYKEGDKLTVYYNPADPTHVTMSISRLIPAIIIAVGAAAVIGGVVSGVKGFKRYQKMRAQEKEWTYGK